LVSANAHLPPTPARYQIAERQLEAVTATSNEARNANSRFKFFYHVVNKDYADPSNMLSALDLVTTSMQSTFVEGLPVDASDSLIANRTFYVQSAASKARLIFA
jgi:hypothetical protein